MLLYRFADRLRNRRRKRLWAPDQAVGRQGEDLVHRYLQRQGFTVVARNYRARSGMSELDLVAWDNNKLVIVEVKSRSSDAFGPPDRAIDMDKRRNLFRGAREYARRAGVEWSKVRFDIVGVLLGTPPVLTHFRDVFPMEITD